NHRMQERRCTSTQRLVVIIPCCDYPVYVKARNEVTRSYCHQQPPMRIESSTHNSDSRRNRNEMNPNKTKDFDLRQADSVVYQRSRVETNGGHIHPKHVQDSPVLITVVS